MYFPLLPEIGRIRHQRYIAGSTSAFQKVPAEVLDVHSPYDMQGSTIHDENARKKWTTTFQYPCYYPSYSEMYHAGVEHIAQLGFSNVGIQKAKQIRRNNFTITRKICHKRAELKTAIDTQFCTTNTMMNNFTNAEMQKQMLRSNFAAAANVSNEDSLLDHMKKSIQYRQMTPDSVGIRNQVNGHGIFGNTISPMAGPTTAGRSIELSGPADPFLYKSLLDLTSSGNIFDHPMLKGPATTLPARRERSYAFMARRHSQTTDRSTSIQDARSFLDDSLDVLLKDDFLPLEGDGSTDNSLANSFMGIGSIQATNPKSPKRNAEHELVTPGLKRQRKSNHERKSGGAPRFRPYQEEQWVEQFQELLRFKEKNGNCLVPHNFPENQTLSRWIKRQRYQYKLKQEGKVSTMTAIRVQQLADAGFVWDSHAAAWQERLGELREYVKANGDCHVPSNYPQNPQLATWVKCQRRQGKLYWNGRPSNMTMERVDELTKLGFAWGIRIMM